MGNDKIDGRFVFCQLNDFVGLFWTKNMDLETTVLTNLVDENHFAANFLSFDQFSSGKTAVNITN